MNKMFCFIVLGFVVACNDPNAEAMKFADDMGLKGGTVDCASMDTDGDGYVSCTVSTHEPNGTVRLTPIECSSMTTVFNQGCRLQKGRAVMFSGGGGVY